MFFVPSLRSMITVTLVLVEPVKPVLNADFTHVI